MLWPAATLDAVDAAIHDARHGVRAVLAVEGAAGFGKSTLLQAAVEKLDGFQVLRAFGEQDARDDRFQLLYEWDALPVGAAVPQHTLQAVRLLAQVVDRLEQTGPVALVLDDVQWIDPESVDALTALVRRAAGVRLLVLAAYRPLGSRHLAWRLLVGRVLRLDGLDGPAAAAFVAALDPAAPAALAEQLRIHTGGSPLHMRALLQEHPTHELTVMAARGALPAPADLAATVHARVAALAPDAAQLLRALAVLGDAWADLPTAAAVGGVRDGEAAVAVLRDEGLRRLDRTAVVPRIRIAHAVICAAVYEVIPTSARRRLHGAAAARLAEPGARLRHRFAATLGPDEGLAADLEHHADRLHGEASFREAARFRLLAASATAADAQRLRHPRRRRAVQPHRHRRADQDPAVRDRRRRRPVLQRPARRAGPRWCPAAPTPGSPRPRGPASTASHWPASSPSSACSTGSTTRSPTRPSDVRSGGRVNPIPLAAGRVSGWRS